jgi:hypothetical protein
MDPYLEDPAFWRDFHSRFINACSEVLSDRLPPGYEARIDEQLRLVEHTPELVIDRLPDVAVTRGPSTGRQAATTRATAGSVATLEPVAILTPIEVEEVHDTWIEILHRPERSLVTVIEILPPTNKAGAGYAEYRNKRIGILGRRAHLVEVDLLLGGRRHELGAALPRGDYYAYVTRDDRRPYVDVYAWTLRDALPTIPVPLKAPDPDIGLNIAEVFGITYQRGRYARSLPYGSAPTAPLEADALQWATNHGKIKSEGAPG